MSREVGASDVKPEAEGPVASVALDPAEGLRGKTEPALRRAAALERKLRLDEEAVVRVGEAVSDEVVGATQRPEARLVPVRVCSRPVVGAGHGATLLD